MSDDFWNYVVRVYVPFNTEAEANAFGQSDKALKLTDIVLDLFELASGEPTVLSVDVEEGPE